MSVPARNNGHGSYSFTENMIQTTTSTKASDGSVTTSQRAWVQAVHACQRSAKIKAAYTAKTSFQIQFRSPTSYDRGVRNVTWSSGIWVSSGSGTAYSRIVQEGPPDSKASWSMFNCAPLMTGNYVSIDTNLRNQARTECLVRLKEGVAELGETLGQARHTVNMLATRYRDLAYLLLCAKRGQWGLIPKTFRMRWKEGGPRTLSNLWLEIQYGWLPLMREVYGLYELAVEQARQGTVIRKAREVFDKQSFDRKVIHSGWESSVQGRRSHKCVLYAVIDNDKVRNFNRTSVLSPSTPWQLVRLSFVVDWMVPIGNFLEALTANWGVEFLGGYDSQWCEYTAEARLLPTGSYKEETPKTGSMDAFSYRRQRLTGFPAPVPYIKSPFSGQHLASAIALFHSLAFK